MNDKSRRIEQLEEAMAHLLKGQEELSEQLAMQWKKIDMLEKSAKHHESRLGELEENPAGNLPDEKPPHW